MEVSNARSAPVQATQQPTAAQKARLAEQETRPQPTESKPTPEQQPKPVVNTQGQTTGRLLNVTA